MLKTSFLIIVILAGFLTTLKAQSTSDAGISVHNYKHPNKAAKAKAMMAENKSIRVASMNSAESFYKRQNRNTHITTTPKYAPRPATLVITRKYERETEHMNPHLSPRNYKTPNSYKRKETWETADYQISSDSTLYPTVD